MDAGFFYELAVTAKKISTKIIYNIGLTRNQSVLQKFLKKASKSDNFGH